ncbi:MAG: FUSC family protein [Proteobacteria bacterium]|nr:FUSC family protein [Pseudomonadota bacterium]
MPASLRSWVPRIAMDVLFPPDPGALRLRAAFAATLAGVLTFFLVMALGTVVAVPVADRILGFAIALFIAANLRDPTPRQRLATIALAPVAAFAATTLAAFLLDRPLTAATAVPPMMFVVAYAAARGPRYALLGIVALIAYFVGLVTRQPPPTLPIRLLVLLLAAGDAALVRGLLLADRPEAELARLRHAIRAGIGGILARIAAALAAGGWTPAARTALHRDIDRFGEAVMLAQARVAAIAAEVPGKETIWLHLLELELATERTARMALEDLGAPADRPPLAATLDALRHGRALPEARGTGPLANALALLDRVLRTPPHTGLPAVGAPGNAPGGSQEAARTVAAAPPPPAAPPALRPALQTAIAAAVAVAGGAMISPNRWYWAAFAAFVMFQGTRSRAESIAKGVQFMLGTLAGVVAGTLVATLLAGHDILTMAAIVAAVFLAFQANVAAYGTMVFWITIILGLLFGMLGYFTPDLLLLRLQEAAVGAACGALVASLVLVRREGAATRDATIAFLRALDTLVDGAGAALLGAPPAADLPARILTAEQRFHELNAIARSEQRAPMAARNEVLRRHMLLLEACEQWARELGQMSLNGVRLADPALARAAQESVARITTTLPSLIGRLADATPPGPIDAAPAPNGTPNLEGGLPERAVRLLLRIDAALVHLATV